MRALWCLVVLAAACGEDSLEKGDSAATCAPDSVLTVEPPSLGRGDNVPIVITWALDRGLDEPRATLELAQQIDVEVPLAEQESGVYGATQLNPFGLGSPSGDVSVLARATVSGCSGDTLRVASIHLE
jgi:hypothetical protein